MKFLADVVGLWLQGHSGGVGLELYVSNKKPAKETSYHLCY